MQVSKPKTPMHQATPRTLSGSICLQNSDLQNLRASSSDKPMPFRKSPYCIRPQCRKWWFCVKPWCRFCMQGGKDFLLSCGEKQGLETEVATRSEKAAAGKGHFCRFGKGQRWSLTPVNHAGSNQSSSRFLIAVVLP